MINNKITGIGFKLLDNNMNSLFQTSFNLLTIFVLLASKVHFIYGEELFMSNKNGCYANSDQYRFFFQGAEDCHNL